MQEFTTLPGESPVVAPTSLGARLGNILVSPSEVFNEVKESLPNTSNWLVPTILSIVVGIIYTMVIFSQPAIIQALKDAPFKAIEKKVSQGKLTRQQADNQIKIIEPIYEKWMSPTVFKVGGILGLFVAQPSMLFLFALLMWLVGVYVFRAPMEYMQAVEVVGLAGMVMVLGVVVQLFLTMIYGNLYMTPGPVLLLSHFDETNPLHILLSSLNLIWIWYLTVLSLGLARLSGTSFIKAAPCAFGIWFILLAMKLTLIIVMARLGGK